MYKTNSSGGPDVEILNDQRFHTVRPMKDRINCTACKFYHITWDRNHPHGCRAMGFKGKEIPLMTVLKTTGAKCLFYEGKKHAAKKTDTQ